MLTSSFRKKLQKFKRRKNERKGVKTKPVTNSSIKAKTIIFHKDKSKTLFHVKNTFLFLLKSFFLKLNWFTFQQLVICWLYFKVNL
jgi:hypothetical protein